MTADIRAQIAETRIAQGLPPTIEDAVLLRQLAAALLTDEQTTEDGAAA
jgi:hypothetical protein